MSNNRTLKVLLVLVALLLAANLVRPLLRPVHLYAQDKAPQEAVAISGSGATVWVLKGKKIYYISFDRQFESIEVIGPKELED